MTRSKLLFFGTLIASLAYSQTTNTTSATCSPITPNNKGLIDIHCSGLTVDQAKLLKDIPALINQLLRAERKNSAQMLSHLDACLQDVQEMRANSEPRRLGTNQASAIADALRIGPIAGVIFGTHMFDGEADDFAKDLKSVLSGIHWQIVGNGLWTRNDRGLFVAQVSGAPVREMDRLCQALISAGLSPSKIRIDPNDKTLSGPGFQPGFIYILVGRR